MKLLIVNFHYYREEKYDSGIYPVSSSNFKKQIDTLSKSYTFISQHQLVKYIQDDIFPEGNFCLITFDDGLKEQMNAFTWLKENNIPALFYIPLKPIQEKIVLDVHKLHWVRAQIADLELIKILKKDASYEYNQVDADRAKDQYKYDDQLAREIKYQLNFKLSQETKTLFIQTAFQSLYPNEALFSKDFYMDEHNIQELANAGMLGSHGYAHIPLAQSENAKDDIIKSIHGLEQIAQIPIVSFSYPYGSKAAVNEEITSYFKGTNIRFALTMWRGLNDEHDIKQQPYLLKRIDTNDAPGGKNNSTEFSLIAHA